MTSASTAGVTAERSAVSVPGEGPLRAAVHRMVAPGADAVFYELWLPLRIFFGLQDFQTSF
jgi:hypothetical protein